MVRGADPTKTTRDRGLSKPLNPADSSLSMRTVRSNASCRRANSGLALLPRVFQPIRSEERLPPMQWFCDHVYWLILLIAICHLLGFLYLYRERNRQLERLAAHLENLVQGFFSRADRDPYAT